MRLRLTPGDATTFFQRQYDDLETLLAVHRFAWLPVMGEAADPSWVVALWRAWRDRFTTPDDGWAWHPYTAAERAINLMDFAARHGLPDPDRDIDLLACHGTEILARLEYFGDHYTSNHLSNDGRGVYRIGLALGIEALADVGARILLAEADRIFQPSGMLREGSSHYHLLITRNYLDCWLAARRHERPEADAFETICRHALAAARLFDLPGGLPLIGDISPDCPPAFLTCLLPGGDPGSGWTGGLGRDDRDAVMALRDSCGSANSAALDSGGWRRLDHGDWSCLWHVAPDGWPLMPGHGHQDTGSFEVHFGTVALFRDPGRGSYRDAADVSAMAQNGISIDGNDPYPANRPYYDDAFRHTVAGAPPVAERSDDGLRLTFQGFTRLAGVGAVTRQWRFSDRLMVLTDRVDGRGTHEVTRRLHTVLPVEQADNEVLIDGGSRRFRIRTDGAVTLQAATCWTTYGDGVPATAIEIAGRESLPYDGNIEVEVLHRDR